MRRLLAAAVTAAALAAPAQAAVVYDRDCGGALDYQCNGWHCSLDCFRDPCLVWIDATHNPHSALCVPPLV